MPLTETELRRVFERQVIADVKMGMLTSAEMQHLRALLEKGHGISYVCEQHERITKPRRRRRGYRLLLVLAAVLLLLLASQVFAQLPFLPGGPGMPVYDAANHLQNTITAVEAVAQTINQIIELTALEGFILDSAEFFEDLAALEVMVQEGVALGWELRSLQSQILTLLDLDTAPMTSFEYRQCSAEIRRTVWLAYSYAMRVQTLIQSAIRTVSHIAGILEQVAGAIGNLTVSQTIGQSQAKLQQLLVENNLQRVVFERAKSLEGAADAVLLQAEDNILEHMMSDHPRR